MIIAVIYSGCVVVIFLFLVIIVDSAQLDSQAEAIKLLPLALALTHLFSVNLLWPLIEQFESAIKARRADLDCLFGDYTAIYFSVLDQIHSLYPLELWASLISGLNVVVNQNDWQIIADVL